MNIDKELHHVEHLFTSMITIVAIKSHNGSSYGYLPFIVTMWSCKYSVHMCIYPYSISHDNAYNLFVTADSEDDEGDDDVEDEEDWD